MLRKGLRLKAKAGEEKGDLMPKKDNQITGNVGLYYVCYQLSKRGWNCLPTSRNAKGVDLLIYSQDATKKYTIQIKALSQKNPVPFGSKPQLYADYLIICRKVFDSEPEVFILDPKHVWKISIGEKRTVKYPTGFSPRRMSSMSSRTIGM